ncbi:DUF799 domain-containing protein [Idiomarina sp. UBA3162]|uniref:DUF799 domain-containing protein n=1 Tax=Idiomarina sp. UBA3162 TaxID=1946641 RepID=UPI000C89BA62|nr:GNA1162 family protein [Idiomarina sp. UBA3162]MAD52835.1 hypothetical protein [Idiomarinaceae bacterium]|tara:strand:- start:1246 stop:1929 length:684 start_codon:yes stop_codon:yes gene_type:complete
MSLKQIFRAVISTVVVVTLAGCAAPGPDNAFLQPLHEEKPRSILVVPVNNETIDVQAPTSVLATLPMVLGERGYYVFPVNTVKTLLENEGYYEPAEVHAAPPESLATMFGADTVLYVTIHEWTSQYMLLTTTTTVDFEYRLVNADGAELWQARKQLSYNPNNQNSTGNPLADLISMAVTAAIERAAPNYLPLTRTANFQTFYNQQRGLPPGPYSPVYDEYYKQVNTQ